MARQTSTFDRGAVMRRRHGQDARVEVQATINFAPDDGRHQHRAITDEPVRLWLTPHDLRQLRAQGTQVDIGPYQGSMVPDSREPHELDDPSPSTPTVPGRVTISLHLDTARVGRQFIPGWGLRTTRPVVVQ